MTITKNEDGTYSKPKQVEEEIETFTREQKVANLEALKKKLRGLRRSNRQGRS